MHDERYRTVFAFPRMVENLLRGFVAREWTGALDFSTLRNRVGGTPRRGPATPSRGNWSEPRRDDNRSAED